MTAIQNREVTAGHPERVLYMDAARSVLMLLGVVLHTSNLYRLDSTWVVADTQQHWVFSVIWATIHAFRMPAFFFISGFFCALTLHRYGAMTFFRKRLPRIVLPLAVVAVLLNVPQVALLDSHAGPAPYLTWAFWIKGGWLFHLWFLVDLVLFFALTAALDRPLRRLAGGVETLAGRLMPLRPHLAAYLTLYGLIVAAFGFVLLVGRVMPGMYDRPTFLPSLFEFFWYFLFFLTGYAAQVGPAQHRGFRVWGWLPLVIGALLWLVKREVGSDGMASRILDSLSAVSLTLGYVYLVLSIFQQLFDREAKLWRYLSDATYTIYLVHHIVVVLLGNWLIGGDWPAWGKFVIICLAATALPLAVHHFVVLRFPWARLLLNGRMR